MFEYVQRVPSRLINLAFRKGTLNEWKTAVLTMIPKKTLRSNDPADYRPICLLCCISKVLERLVKTRLYTFLENSDIILKQQSGLRSNRGKIDNLRIVKPFLYSSIYQKLSIKFGMTG